MSVNGIDIASYQSTSYDTTNLDFVLVKATEGSNYTNPRHAGQVAFGRARSLVVGHYHFVRPGPMTAQAAYFLRHAAPAAGEILALDWEDEDVSGAEKDAWIRHVQAAAPTHRVILYCNRDFWLSRDTTSFCGDGLWIADPGAAAGRPRVNHPWTFHQYSERAGLDRNVANFPSPAALRAWAAGQHITPEDTMPTAQEIATATADLLITPKYRDALASASLYWLVRVLDPDSVLPTGPDAPGAAVQAAALRTALAKHAAGSGITDAQLDTMSGRIVTALVGQAATPKES